MPLPTSGALSMSQIRDEFGGTNPVSLSQYYRGGALVPSSVANIEPISSNTDNVVTNATDGAARFFWNENVYHVKVILDLNASTWFFEIVWNSSTIASGVIGSFPGDFSDIQSIPNSSVEGSSTYFRETGTERKFENLQDDQEDTETFWFGVRRETGTVTVNSSVPTSGTIKISDFYGAKKTL